MKPKKVKLNEEDWKKITEDKIDEEIEQTVSKIVEILDGLSRKSYIEYTNDSILINIW